MPDSNDIPYQFDIFRIIDAAFFSDSSSGGDPIAAAQTFADRIFMQIVDIWQLITILGIFVSLLCIFGLIYSIIRYNQLSEIEARGLREKELLYDELYRKSETKNRRWQDVLKHIESDSPNDWKLAIIEADVMLEELLDAIGYSGVSVGDKLKSAAPAAFNTIDQAWKAHMVRNKIAHQGSDFILTKRIAEETITQYKMVFEEFDFI